jgi:transcriptional regulator of acetoin/glycerol metabolism
MTLIKTNSPKLHREARLAREKLHLEGEVPDGVLRAEIDASWRRSLSHGVHFNAKHELALESSTSVDVLLASNRLLIDAALPAIDYLAERQGKDGLIILANSDATILAVEGRADRLKGSGLQDITLGACWSEAARGTNALGTALVEARPTLIDCGEHYLDRLSDFSCTSVPIHCPQGDILGVLDLTREGPLGRAHDSTALLAMAVSQIESRVFNASYPDEIVLAFHSRRQYLESPWQGLLAVSLGGQILAVSAQACQLLHAERSALVGRRCEEFLGVDGLQLLARLHQGGAGSLQTAKGEFFYKTLRAPQRTINVSTPPRSVAKTAKPQPQPDLQSLAGSNARYARALRMARQGLANELPVLLLGETGTGKEVIARALHMAGARCDKPFVAVNCAAIPEGLIESELFGYREGAFTGSRRGGMVGRLQQAHGGTLFLDEIGDMPLALQARLLRVLQDRKVAPLGAGEEQDIDIALICATHRDLKRLVEEKHFREDLFYRVNGISVMLPALREREDFVGLVSRMLSKLDAPDVVLHDDLDRVLAGYHWPGNIRQLEMVLRTALAMREPGETVLTLDHLPDSMLDELTATERPQAGSIRENELEMIRQSLDSHQGNVSAAADALGISRATLYRKLKQLRS